MTHGHDADERFRFLEEDSNLGWPEHIKDIEHHLCDGTNDDRGDKISVPHQLDRQKRLPKGNIGL